MAVFALTRPSFLPARWPTPTATHVALIALGLVLVLQIGLIFSKSINWDEFFHFSEINQSLLGRPVLWLQTPFVQLFSWVPGLPGTTISHIQLIRLFLLPFELITLIAIFASARHLSNARAALVCTLAYAAGGYVFLHALALRADVIAAALLTSALWIALARPIRLLESVTIALLFALAFVATIKSVLYVPAFAGIVFYRLECPDRRKALIVASLAAAVASITLLAVGSMLPDTGPMGALRDLAQLGRNSVDRMFTGGLFPQGRYLWKQILLAPFLTAIICLAFVYAVKSKNRLVFLALLAPFCTVAVYRNAFPYHFAFILPPAMIAAGPAANAILRRYGLTAVSLALSINAAILFLVEDGDVLKNQKTVLEGLETVFPKPVTYIDESGMVGHYPRAIGRFASGWALANYRSGGHPAYREAMTAETIPLLIVNSFALQNVFQASDHPDRLLPADERALSENYIPHWGMAFVAGKEIPRGPTPLSISVLVPGIYTVEGGNIQIDGVLHGVGDFVILARGTHEIGGSRRQETRLRWGKHLPHPNFPWPAGPLFTDY